MTPLKQEVQYFKIKTKVDDYNKKFSSDLSVRFIRGKKVAFIKISHFVIKKKVVSLSNKIVSLGLKEDVFKGFITINQGESFVEMLPTNPDSFYRCLVELDITQQQAFNLLFCYASVIYSSVGEEILLCYKMNEN